MSETTNETNVVSLADYRTTKNTNESGESNSDESRIGYNFSKVMALNAALRKERAEKRLRDSQAKTDRLARRTSK